MPVPSDRDLDIADRYAAGARVIEMAAELGVGRATIYTAVNKVARYRQNLAALEREPHNIRALAGAGRFPIGLSRTLEAAGILTLEGLAARSRRDLMHTPMVGKAFIAAVETTLAAAGLHLSPDPPRRR